MKYSKENVTPSNIDVSGNDSFEEKEMEFYGIPLNTLSNMKCIVCNGLMTSEIRYCQREHNVCDKCFRSSHPYTCRLCGQLITSDMRNRDLENYVSKLVRPCPNLGCPVVSFLIRLDDHIEICEYKNYLCPMIKYKYNLECGWLGKIHEMRRHIETDHLINFNNNIEEPFSLTKFNRYINFRMMNFFPHEEMIFLLHLSVSPTRKVLTWQVQIVGTQLKAARWNYAVRVFNTYSNDIKAMFVDEVMPYSRDAERLMDCGDTPSIHLDHVHHYLNHNGELRFQILIIDKRLRKNNSMSSLDGHNRSIPPSGRFSELVVGLSVEPDTTPGPSKPRQSPTEDDENPKPYKLKYIYRLK